MAILLAACSNASKVSYKDGVYTGESDVDQFGGKIITEITVTDNKISDVKIQNLDDKGNEKGEDYGKKDGLIEDQETYKKAQKSVTSTQEYAKALVKKQVPDDLESISGATSSLKTVKQAANRALETAK